MSSWDRPWSVELIGGATFRADVLGELVTVDGPLWAMTPAEARMVAHALLMASCEVDGRPPVVVDLTLLLDVARRLGVPVGDLATALAEAGTGGGD